jgi:hypothetical protein
MDRRDYMARYGSEKPILYRDDEEIELPTIKEVCPTCRGTGKHVNPSIDAHGISPKEFHEDPSFAEDYFRGAYDVVCYECGGNNVIDVVDRENCPQYLLDEYDEQIEEEQSFRRMSEAERRMGA